MGLDPGREAVHVLHAESSQGAPQPGHAAAQFHGQRQAGQGLRGGRRRPGALQGGARAALPAGEQFHEAGEGAGGEARQLAVQHRVRGQLRGGRGEEAGSALCPASRRLGGVAFWSKGPLDTTALSSAPSQQPIINQTPGCLPNYLQEGGREPEKLSHAPTRTTTAGSKGQAPL